MTDEPDVSSNGDVGRDVEGEGEQPTVGNMSSKKLLLFGWIAIVVLAVGAAGGYFTGLFGVATESGTDVAEAQPVAHYIDLDEMVVNLGAGEKSGFLKMQVRLELESAADEAPIKAAMPRIVDNFQVFLRELRIEELKGSHGLYRVKEELLVRVNAAAYPTKVKDVLFKRILVQ